MTGSRYAVTPSSAAFDTRLTATDHRVLAALGTYADAHGRCFPSQGTLARRLGVARCTVSRSIARLVECGHLRSGKRNGARGARLSNTYTIVMASDQGELPLNPAPDVPLPCSMGATPVPVTPVAPAQHPCSTGATQTNPSNKPNTSPCGEERAGRGNTVRSKRRSKPNLAGTTLPDDWTPPDEDAIELGVPLHAIPTMRAKFIAHYRRVTGDRALSRDWRSSWRFWCLDQLERQPNGGASRNGGHRWPGRGTMPDGRPSPSEPRDALAAALARDRAERAVPLTDQPTIHPGAPIIDLDARRRA